MAMLEVIGMGCRRCLELLHNAEEAVRLARRSDSVEKVTDYTRIAELNPWALPALAIDGKVVVVGRVATREEIRELLAATSSGRTPPNSPDPCRFPKEDHHDADGTQDLLRNHVS